MRKVGGSGFVYLLICLYGNLYNPNTFSLYLVYSNTFLISLTPTPVKSAILTVITTQQNIARPSACTIPRLASLRKGRS
jgi:hypothetical protein